MDATTFEMRFKACTDALQTPDRSYRRGKMWANVGKRALDLQLAELADLYWEVNDEQRRQLRDAIAPHLISDLFLFVRRILLLIDGEEGLDWFRRGLASVALENGRSDYRDTIVSLVLLRHAAESAGIETKAHFDEAIEISEDTIRELLENARDHAESDVKYTVREFGPPQWQKKPKK